MPIWDRLDRELVRRALSAAPAPATLAAGRRAAVAALLADGENGVELCLIRRAERAREELGVELDRDAQLLGRLRDFKPVSSLDLSVTPFIFGIGTRPAVSLNPEVDLALWIPVAELASGVTLGWTLVQRP